MRRNLIVCDSLALPKRRRIEAVEAATVREAIAPLTDGYVVVEGERWGVDRWDDPLPAAADVFIAPRIAEASTIISLILLAVSTAYSVYEQQRLKSKLRRAAQPGDDQDSPTYNFASAQSTTAGPGFAIATLCGRRRIGGHVISQTIRPGTRGEDLYMLVVKSRGPIHAIGGEQGLPNGERDEITVPANVRVNGVSVTSNVVGLRRPLASIRLGHPHQSRLEYFPIQSFTQAVGQELVDAGSRVAVVTQQSDFIDDGYLIFDYPGGLHAYNGSQQRIPHRIDMDIVVRDVNGVQVYTRSFSVAGLSIQPFADWQYFGLGSGGRRGPYTIEVIRTTSQGDPSSTVDQVIWRAVTQHYFGDFTHPGLAILGLRLPANQAIQDQIQSVTSVDDGILVRTWLEEGQGWSEYGWGPKPPHWTYDVGRNAAWLVAELLLNRHHGIGHEIRKTLGGTGNEELDLESFRDASFHCDVADPNDPTKAKYRCDYHIDAVRSVEEHVQAMCRTSRVYLAKEGDRIVLRPEYLAAFGPPGYVVPIRKELRPLSTSNCRSVTLTFRNPLASPNLLVAEFDNQANNYLPDQVTVVDEERMRRGVGNLLPRTVRSDVQLRGITDRRQAIREAFHMLMWFRYSSVEGRVTTGLHAIPLQTRDLIWLHHECWWPDPDSPGTGARSVTDSPDDPVSEIVLDRDLQIYGAARAGTGIFLMDPDGKTLRHLLVDAAGPDVIPAGDPVPLWDPELNGGTGGVAQVKVTRHTMVLGGKYGTFARRFVVVTINTTQELESEMELAEWHPGLHDEPAPELLELLGAVPESFSAPVPVRPEPAPGDPRVADEVDAVPTRSPGVAAIRIARDSDTIQRGRARVYARPAGTSLPYDLVAEPLGESAEMQLERGVTYDVVAVLPGPGGSYPSPDDVDPVQVRVPVESGPAPASPAPSGTVLVGRRLRLTWPRTQGAVAYEVRRGASWLGARRLATTADTLLEMDAEEGVHRLMVRARSASGSWSDVRALTVTVAHAESTLATINDDTTTGTHDGTVDGTGGLRIVDPGQIGTYTTPDLDPGEELAMRWSAVVDWYAEDLLPVADMVDPVAWWTYPVQGADVDEASRGVQMWGNALADHTEPLEQWIAHVDDGNLPLGYRGGVRLEVAFRTSSVWGDWLPYTGPVVVLADRMRARLTLFQETPRYRVVVDRIRLAATPQ